MTQNDLDTIKAIVEETLANEIKARVTVHRLANVIVMKIKERFDERGTSEERL